VTTTRIVALALALAPLAVLPALALASSSANRLPAVVSVRDGDLWVDGKQILATAAEETAPDWSPDKRRIVFSRFDAKGLTASIFVVRRDGGGLVRLTHARDRIDLMPAWSPDGRRVAFARSPLRGGSFDVYTVAADGASAPRLAAGGADEQIAPRWQGGTAVPLKLVPGEPWPEKTSDAGTPRSGPRELLPDFDQRAPSRLTLAGTRLGFASATDNLGDGPIWVRGTRTVTVGTMRATQLVRLSDGGVRPYPVRVRLRYTPSPTHTHWHLLRFQSYELRRADDHDLVVRDRKSGFCLADHYGLAARRTSAYNGAHFFGNCAQGNPAALAVEQGTSPGFTDLYPPHFHGQNIELAGVPAGSYVLVHRANPTEQLEELDYGNNAAALRIRLTWSGRTPHVETLRVCETTEYC
jgi:dipeptidyl aminopeptidase/acylaminoacyl peptidase